MLKSPPRVKDAHGCVIDTFFLTGSAVEQPKSSSVQPEIVQTV